MVKNKWVSGLAALLFLLPVTAAGQDTDPPLDRVNGYALIMANGTKIKISEYLVDPEKQTVFFKSERSGLSATFPLERICRVVRYDSRLADVPDDALPLYIPEKTSEYREDGGIPVLFNVRKTIVGSGGSSGGGTSGYSRAGGNRSSNYRNNYRASSATGSSSGLTGGSTSSSGKTSGYSAGSSSSGSSSSSAESFMNALFGGKN
ncbi:hypothetical protein JXA80_01485 [bacterium]|nr:hypothetical protein [candidate division CSSED10-310 bacterium]